MSKNIKSHPDKITAVALLLEEAIRFFKQEKTDVLIPGCTELSLVVNSEVLSDIPVVDPAKVVANSLIREALKH